MILFKNDKIEIDLSGQGVSLNEESSLFKDNIFKSYSLPFTIRADHDLLQKLGLPYLDNISEVATKISGKLILPDRYYDAVLFLGEVQGETIECDLSYGEAELPVYDLPLKDLPWPIILSPDVVEYANGTVNKQWPETPCNFPMVYHPQIKEESNYEQFLGFVNNYDSQGYKRNYSSGSGDSTTHYNQNVLTPYPYLMEILRFGYSLEGKKITGPVVDNELLRKVLYLSEKYLEKFRGSEYQNFSFTTATRTETSGSNFTYGIYERQFTLQNDGSYELKFNFNLDPTLAAYFELEVFQVNPTTGDEDRLYRARSSSNRVKLEEELKINITPGQVLDNLKIKLKIPFTAQSISQYNNFEFSFEDGQLNEFPSYFSLGDFMPDMTFGEYVNELKNWLNIEFQVGDSEVYIDFIQDAVLKKERTDHTHLEIPKPKKSNNSNRIYKLSYANGEKVSYNANGQIYSDLDEKGMKEVKIEMDVQPAVVESIKKVTTAVMPEDKSKLDFIVYDGMQGNRPECSPDLTALLSLQNVFEWLWEVWLRYRVHSKTFKETFECSVHERISTGNLSFKYHELHVIKKLYRKFLSENVMRVEVESETF